MVLSDTRVRTIPGWPGYCISPGGQVFGPRRKLNPVPVGGYPRVRLYRGGEAKWFMVHVLVMDLYGPSKPSINHQIDHLSGDRADSSIHNLEWVTASENCVRRSVRLGGNPTASKAHLPCGDCGVRQRRVVSGKKSSYCNECHAAKEILRYKLAKEGQ